MDYQALKTAAENVIRVIETQPPQYTSPDILDSIKNQMIFIRDHATSGKNPSSALPSGTKFTYAILASRELASPDEIALKELIDEVTKILIHR